MVRKDWVTPIGNLELVPTSKTHVSIRAKLTFRGKPYHANIHLYKQPDGTWLGQYVDQMGKVNEDKPYFNPSPAPTFRDKMLQAIHAGWQGFLLSPEGPSLLALAQAQDAADRLSRARVECETAEKAHAAAVTALKAQTDHWCEAMRDPNLTEEQKQELRES